MAIPNRKLVALCLGISLIAGCTSVKVVRNPDEGDTGVRFFRPKPYLLVTPADPTGRLVNLKLEYLPDFNEEYSAHLKGKASVALKDGWNLVGVNTKDAPKEKDEPPAKIEDIKLPAAVVSATNVPIGYYESVYGVSDGRKFLQGWRYVGLTALGGGQPGICHVPGHNPKCPPTGGQGCISGPLYGLVFFNGVMTFRQLDEIANNQLCPMYVNPTPSEPAATLAPSPVENKVEINRGAGTPEVDIKRESTPPLPAPGIPGPSSYNPKANPALVSARPSTPSRPMPTAVRPLASATNLPRPTPAKSSSTLTDRDPLSGMPAGLDPDLFRTGSSPKP